MNAREEILRRIDRAAPVRPAAEVEAGLARIDRRYLGQHHTGDADATVALFAERVADYRATVLEASATDVAAVVTERLAARPGVYGVPGGLPAEWTAGAPVARDPSVADLDGLAGAVTACAVAIAETGTIVLDHGPEQGPRALSLVPDFHLIVVRADQIAPDVPDALRRLDPRRPLTFVSGPSATSDIELTRVEGVHGPRVLEVLILR
ncbi:LutC/YkgG family protein [Actinomadura terrae]|uniref:LutC/YkgG family protein n=1 Tax=Actinomadura terrae TaxID=604353 RepID=UPI001FA74CD8|nr:LUD domain-containing protein [Actinomadura terrae]